MNAERSRTLWLLPWLLLLLSGWTQAADLPQRQVLVLWSGHDGLPWQRAARSSLLRRLAEIPVDQA